MKEETNKTWWSHIPFDGIEGAANIITKSAIKFDEEEGLPGWQNLDDGFYKYLDALMRHLIEMKKGNRTDESGFLHSEHLIANAIILDDILR